MFTFSTNIKSKLAVAAVVAAGAFAIPSVASAQTASGCPSSGPACEFVGGAGHDASTDTGGATQFRINTSPNATVVCTDSRASAVTNGTALVTTTLTFEDCTAAGFGAVVTCTSSDITLTSGGSGNGAGDLNLSQNNCTINVASGSCVIQTSADVAGQDIHVDVTGATGSGTAQITAGITDNTDALTFTASGGLCGIAGVPSTGSATFSNSPNSGAITYDEVPSTSPGLIIS